MLKADDIRAAIQAAQMAGEFDSVINLVENYVDDQLVDVWAKVRHGKPGADLDDIEYTEAHEEVERIRRSEAAVRLAVRHLFDRQERKPLPGPPEWIQEKIFGSLKELGQPARGLPRMSELRHLRYYDSCEIEANKRIQLFGNANIGMLNRTNLQVAGQLTFDNRLVTTSWFATTIPKIGGVSLDGVATFTIGDKPIQQAPLHLLLQGRQELYYEIRERMNVSVAVDFHNTEAVEGIRLYTYVEGWGRRDVL